MYSKDRKSFNGRKIFIQNGYECIDDGHIKYVHRLLMEEHLGRPLNSSEEVHHKDKIKQHNEISNFELKSKSQHVRDHWDPTRRAVQKGSKNNRAKLTEEKVIEIISKVKSHDDIKSVASEYDVGYHCIWGIYKGKSWKHVLR